MKSKTRLQTAREKSGKTQVQVAKEAHLNVRVYQNYEYDANEPAIRTAIRIADVLNIKDLRILWDGNPAR